MLIGAHVSSSGGLVRALERAEERGAETMQIFNQSPRDVAADEVHRGRLRRLSRALRREPV